MPPKKKGKQKGKAASAKNKPALITPVTEPLPEISKEKYLNQIRDLEGRLARYQRRWDELQVREANFQAELEQVTQDKKEIVDFLKRTLDQRTDEIAELSEKTDTLQQSKDVEKEGFEAQLSQVRNEFQETKDQLTSENMLLAGKLAALEEFRVQKEELAEKYAALEELLKQQELDHKEVIYNLERKAVVDKDRLKKEMVQRVNMVAGEFRKVSNNQIAETTKRTIRENMSICAQLAKMSDKSMELVLENDRLKQAQTEQHRNVELLEHNEKVLVKNNLSNQTVIRMLTEKCQEQQMLLDQAMEKDEAWRTLQNSYKGLQEENKSLRERVAQLEKVLKKHESEGERIRADLQLEQKNKKIVENILGKAANALKDVLLEKPEEEEDLEGVFDERRHQMLHKLLALLNTAAALGLGPKLHEFLQEKTSMEEITVPRGERLFSLSPVLKDTGGIAHYRIGDLGLVPRPYQSSAFLSKMGMLSKTTRLGPLRGSKSAPKYLFPINGEEKQMKQPLLPDIVTATAVTSEVALEVVPKIVPEVVAEASPEVVAEVAPALTPKVITEVTPEVATEVATEVAPEVVTEVAPEVVAEVTAEVIAEVAPEVIAEVTPEVVTEVAPEVVAEVAPEVIAEVAPEVIAEVAPEVIAEVAPEVIAEVAPEVIAEVAPEVIAEVASEVTPEVIVDVVPEVVPEVISEIILEVASEVALGVTSGVVSDVASGVASGVVSGVVSEVIPEIIPEVVSEVVPEVAAEVIPEDSPLM